MVDIHSEAQNLEPSGIVSLFTLDTTSVGGTILFFVQGHKHGKSVMHGGIEYRAVDIQFEGLEITGAGALPTPTIRISNTDGMPQAIVNTWGDLLGCTVQRIRTFARFLDGEPDEDPTAYFGPDIFRVERRSKEDATQIEWELSASIDQEGKQIPGRQVIRDTCLWRYRAFIPSTGMFNYSKAQCPFAENKFYDIEDNEVFTPAEDVPSRRLSCCRARFGADAPLPFGGFPGIARSG